MRRWLLGLGIGLGALVLVLGLAVAWLLNTGAGRDVVLARLVVALPPGALVWERAEGRLGGVLVLHDVHYRSEDGLDVRAGRVELDARLRSLLARTARVDRLWIEDVVIRLAEPGEPDPEAADWAWPAELPTLELPLAVEVHELGVRRLRVEAFDEAPVLEASRIDLAGRFGNGRLALERLEIDSDRGDLHLVAALDSAQAWDTQLEGGLALPAVEIDGQAQRATLSVGIAGDLDALQLTARGQVPAPLRLDVSLRNGRSGPPIWTLDLDAEGIDLRLFGADDAERIVLALRGEGEGLDARLEGRVERAGLEVDLLPSRLAWQGQRLDMAPLQLGLYDGQVVVEGHADFAGEQAVLDIDTRIDGVRIPADDQPPLRLDGALRLAGPIEEWTVDGEVAAVRGDLSGRIGLQGRGDTDALVLERFSADVPGGGLAGQGRVQWAPELAWTVDARLSDFDPGHFNPDFPGRIRAQVRSSGSVPEDGPLQAQVVVTDLGGQLRGRELGGGLALDWSGETGRLDADIGAGQSRVRARGQVGERLDLEIELDPLRLSDLLPDTAGTLRGRLGLAGAAGQPDIEADLAGSQLRYDTLAIDSLQLRGQLPGTGNTGRLDLVARGIDIDGTALGVLQAQADGSLAAANLQVQARGDPGALELDTRVGWRDGRVSGELQALRYAPPRGTPWQLDAPAAFAVSDGDTRLDNACLVAATARLCVDADWPRRATIEGRGLPLAMLEPWLAEDGVAFQVDGQVQLDGEFSGHDGTVSGRAQVLSDGGRVRLAGSEREVLAFQRIDVEAVLDPEVIDTRLELRLSGDDHARGSVRLGRADPATLAGELVLAINDLTFVELFSPDIVEPRGELSGRLELDGTLDAPLLRGQAGLQGFSAELPALGIRLEDSQALLRGDAAGEAVVEGVLRSGGGAINLSGRQAIAADTGERRFELELAGSDFLVADIPELRAVISPDVQVVVAEQLRVRGQVLVPSARIDLEQLEGTTQPSDDVVVVDPIDPARERGLPIDALVTVVLGERVELIGFGLEGRLAGQLRVRELTGRTTTATGALDVSGQYTAYGQDLRLERGRLAWTSSAIDNPSLDLVAQREFTNDITVGLRVRGTARQPNTELFSSPPMDNTEALSWLVLGRPLRTASGDEGQQLGAAALALGAGGNVLAEQLGARLGLDEAGIAESRALGGATLSVGKYLSPRLLVSYGVSLLGNGQVLTLKYMLGRGFDIEIESGTESRGSLNWRMER